MDFEVYQHLAMRTTDDTPSDDVRAYQLIHGCTGLVGELHELKTSPSLERTERGDVWWYLARISQALKKPYGRLSRRGTFSAKSLEMQREVVDRAMSRALMMLERAKKVYFQCHDLEKYEEDLFTLAQVVASHMASIDEDLTETWRSNIYKLEERYPDGVFNKEASMNRTR